MTAYLLPILELAGVIFAAVALVSLIVGGLVRLLRRLSDSRLLYSYRALLAVRMLVGYRDDRPGLLRRLVPVSSQNFIAMVGTAMGVWALVVVLSVMGGFESDLKGKIVRQNPHVTITPPPGPEGPVVPGDLPARVAALPRVAGAEAYVEGEAMLTSANNMSPGLVLHGVQAGGSLQKMWLGTTADAATLDALSHPVRTVSDREMGFRTTKKTAVSTLKPPGDPAGAPAAPQAEAPAAAPAGDAATAGARAAGDADDVMPAIPTGSRAGRLYPGIVLGEELARTLGVGAGDEVTAVIPDGDIGPTGVKPRTRTFRVVGTFVSGMYEYDLKTAYLLATDAAELFLLGGPNRVAVMLRDGIDDLEAAADDITGIAGPGAQVRTVAQANKSLFSALLVEKIAMFLVLGLVILVAAFNVFGSLVLITMERSREMAVLQGLGATAGGIRSIFLALGATIGVVGTAAGLVLGLGTCGYIEWVGIRLPAEYYLRLLPVEVRWGEIALVLLAALGAAMLATIYPASSVARVSPADGLRND